MTRAARQVVPVRSRQGASLFFGFASLTLLVGSAAAACSSSIPPNPHDNVINDTTPMPTTTAAVDAAGVDSGFPLHLDIDGGYDDGQPYMNNVPDGYAPLATCAACNCTLNPGSTPAPVGDGGDGGTPPGPPGYCVGGLVGDITPPAPAACAVTGSTPALGCNAVPAKCAGLDPVKMCPCILAIIDFGCYANCAVQGSGVAVYCPSP